MIGLGYTLLLGGLATLGLGAVGLALGGRRAEVVGPVAGGLALALGLPVLTLGAPEGPGPGGLVLDGVSAPGLVVVGLWVLVLTLSAPRRHVEPGWVAALLARGAVHVALLACPPGPLAAGLWVLGCGLVLPGLSAGPARRLGAPYLGLAAALGAVGLLWGGTAGVALALLAVAARTGLPPFQSWAVGAYSLGPPARATAVIAPMFGLALAARLPMAQALHAGQVPVQVLLVLGALLAAALALVQVRLDRATGFLTVSCAGVALLGVADEHNIGHLGGLLSWVAGGTALLGLGLVTAAVRSRRGPVPVDRHLGLAAHAPVLATLFLLFGLSAVGAPGTAAFVSDDLVLHGSIGDHPLLLMALVSTVSLQGYTVLHLFYRVFLGPPEPVPLPDALRRERAGLWLAAALLLLAGVAPRLLGAVWQRGGAAGPHAETGQHAAGPHAETDPHPELSPGR